MVAHWASSIIGKPWRPHASGPDATGHFKAADLTYTPPTGFTAWG